MLPDSLAHRRLFVRVLALPPLHVVQIAAELKRRTLHYNDLKSVGKDRSALMAHSRDALFRLDCAVSRNAPVAAIVQTGRVDRPNGLARVAMPVLAVGEVVHEHGDGADFAKGCLPLVRQGVPPNAAVAAIKSAGAAIVRSAVGHG